MLTLVDPSTDPSTDPSADPARSTSDDDTPDAPGNGGATKPIYAQAEIIQALTTFDGASSSGAWAGNTVTYSIDSGQLVSGQSGYRFEYDGYVDMTPFMEQVAIEAFELWDDLIAIAALVL